MITENALEALAEENPIIKNWKEFGEDCAESTDMKKVFKMGYRAAVSNGCSEFDGWILAPNAKHESGEPTYFKKR